MDERFQRPSWIPWAVMAVVAIAVGAVAYNLGLEQAAAAGTAVPGRYWHVGFPFGLFFLFWIFAMVMRGLFWGGCWGPRFRGRYYRDAWYDDPARWDEWHRRAHDHMNSAPRPPANP